MQKTLAISQLQSSLIQDDLHEGKISLLQSIMLYNHHYIFPVFLSLYLILLLIEQTQLRNLQASHIYTNINQNFILFIVIISGIGTSFTNNNIYTSYIKKTGSNIAYYAYITLCILLSGLAFYIIYHQTIELGIIGIIISILSGILILLVGMLLLEEKD